MPNLHIEVIYNAKKTADTSCALKRKHKTARWDFLFKAF